MLARQGRLPAPNGTIRPYGLPCRHLSGRAFGRGRDGYGGVIWGTASGCVRASVMDAAQVGFTVLVPADCRADGAEAPHRADLYDIDQKYSDVTDAADLANWLAGI